MEQLPKRSSLSQETAATLKEWISHGTVSEVLPGELQLKNRLGVGRDTLRQALKLLVQEGWVEPALQGQQRRVKVQHLKPAKPSDQDHLPVSFLSPHRIEHRITLLELEDTQIQLAGQGRSLQFLAPDLFHLQHPERQLERLVRAHPSAAWILSVTSGPVQRWFAQQGLPTFLYEWPFPKVDLPYVVADWESAAFHAGLQLIRHGHRAIGVFEYAERRPALLAIEQGLQRALATVGDAARMLVFKDDRLPASVARSCELAFHSKDRPTAWILTRTAQVLSCLSWVASRGIRIPAEISIVSLANDSWFEELHPPLAYYAPNTKNFSRHIGRHVMELVNLGQVMRKSIKVPLEYVAGATIGPAPHA